MIQVERSNNDLWSHPNPPPDITEGIAGVACLKSDEKLPLDALEQLGRRHSATSVDKKTVTDKPRGRRSMSPLQRQRSTSLVTSTRAHPPEPSRKASATSQWIQESRQALNRVGSHNRAISRRNLLLEFQEEEIELERRISRTISQKGLVVAIEGNKSVNEQPKDNGNELMDSSANSWNPGLVDSRSASSANDWNASAPAICASAATTSPRPKSTTSTTRTERCRSPIILDRRKHSQSPTRQSPTGNVDSRKDPSGDRSATRTSRRTDTSSKSPTRSSRSPMKDVSANRSRRERMPMKDESNGRHRSSRSARKDERAELQGSVRSPMKEESSTRSRNSRSPTKDKSARQSPTRSKRQPSDSKSSSRSSDPMKDRSDNRSAGRGRQESSSKSPTRSSNEVAKKEKVDGIEEIALSTLSSSPRPRARRQGKPTRHKMRPLPSSGRRRSASLTRDTSSKSPATYRNNATLSPSSQTAKLKRMASASKLYLAEEPEHFLDCSQEKEEIRTLGKKLVALQKQLKQSQKAERKQLKEIQECKEKGKYVLELLQLEKQVYLELNQHAKQAIFETHQDTLLLEQSAEETFVLYNQLEKYHRNEINKHQALTKKLPDLVEVVNAHEAKLKKRETQIKKEQIMTRLADKYMHDLVNMVIERSDQPELIERVRYISTN